MRAWIRMVGLEARALAHSRAWWSLMLGAPLAVVAILSLLASQLDQVAEAQCSRPAAIGAAFLPADLFQQVREVRQNAAGSDAPIAVLAGADATSLRTCLAALADADVADHDQNDDSIADENKAAPPDADARARWRQDAISVLRRHHLVAVAVGLSAPTAHPFRLAVAVDDAHPQADAARTDVNTSLDAWHDTTVDRHLERLHVDPAVRHVLDDRVIPVSAPAENLARTWSGRLATGLGVLMLAGMLPLAARRRAPLSATALAAGGWSARWLTGVATTTVGGGAWLIAGLLLLGLEASPWFGPDVDRNALAQVLSGWWPFAALPALALLAGGMLMSLATVTAPARSAALAVMSLAAVLLASLVGIVGLRPHALVDLVPITGPLVVLKAAAANAPGIWRDLAITTVAHACYGAALAWFATRTRLTWSSTWEAVVLYAAAVAIFTTVSPLFTDQGDPIALCAPLALGVLGVAAMHAFIRRQSPIASWSLRLPAWHWWLTAAFVAPALALAGLAVGDLQPALPAGMTTGAETLDNIATAHWSIALACLALAPAVCEELLFRGAILGLLKQRLPAIVAVLVSALMFAALHGSPWRFLPQFVVGIALAVLTLRSGSVLPAILLHATYNGLLWALDAHNATVREVSWLQTLIDTPWLAATCGGVGVLVMLACDAGWRWLRPAHPTNPETSESNPLPVPVTITDHADHP